MLDVGLYVKKIDRPEENEMGHEHPTNFTV